AGEVRRAQPLLPFAVQHIDVVELARQRIRELARAVRRVVVDDQHADTLAREGAQHRLDVLALVVRGQANDDGGHLRIFNGVAGALPRTSTSRISWSCW